MYLASFRERAALLNSELIWATRIKASPTGANLTANAALLRIVLPPRCLADVASDSADTTRNSNGSVGPEDLEAFVNGFIANNSAIADVASDSSDTSYNPNLSVGPEDLEAFVNAFIAGC